MEIAKVATVIVTWNKLTDVCSLLEDINKLDLHNIQLDIYVVDNASTDGTQTYLEQYYPTVKVLQTGTNLGGSGGFSYGLQTVSNFGYDYIWLLDNDVRLDSLALISLIETLNTYSEVGLVGSQIRKIDAPNTIQEVGSFINSKKAHIKTNFGNYSINSATEILRSKPYFAVDACAAASLLVRCEIVQQIGVFEDYFLHFDDVEWCLRAKQAGWIVAANPASIVWHSSPDFKCRLWISYYDERNLCYCWQKHQPKLVLKRVLVIVPKLIYYAATGRYFLAQVYLQGFRDFIEGVRGKMPGMLPYTEYSIEQLISSPSKVMVQSTIYQDSVQNETLKKLQAGQKAILWLPNQGLGSYIWTWLLALVRKPVDIALLSCHKPNLYAFCLAKQVYFFTGRGYVSTKVSLMALLQAISKTFYQLCQIYWQMNNLLKLGKQ